MRFINVVAGLALAAAPLSGALAKDEALAKAIASPHRTPTMVERDKARKPQEELEFFGIRPNMTVVEISPGAGYWTEILAPYLHDKGTLMIDHRITPSSPPLAAVPAASSSDSPRSRCPSG